MRLRPIPTRPLQATALLLLAGCGGYGERVVAGDTEVFYASGATETDARRLLDFLSTQAPGTPGQRRSYQLARRGETYLVRLVVTPEQASDEALAAALAEDAKRLSAEAFGGQPVEMVLCDEHLRPRRTVPWGSEGFGHKLATDRFDGYYRDGVTEDEARKLLERLARDLPPSRERGSVQLVQRGKAYVLRVILKPEALDDANTATTYRQIARGLSAELFHERPVEVELCDAMFRTQKTLP